MRTNIDSIGVLVRKMACTMPDHYEFVRTENIKAFERQLQTETDPVKRRLLMQLLKEEKAGKLSPPPPGTDWATFDSAE